MALQEELELQGNYLFAGRSTLPIIIIVIGLIVFTYSELNSETSFNDQYWKIYEISCLFVCFIGLATRCFTVGYTPANTSGRNTANQIADKLNTRGIYSIVRHPLYVGNFLMWLGVALLTHNFWFIISFILFYCIYYERIMYAEEQFLRNKFGSKYLAWSEITPAFIPSFKNWKKPIISFSLKKVLKKEKNSLFAIFVLFFLFHFIRNQILKKPFQWQDWHFIALLASALIYIVLRFIKYKTELLEEEGR